MAVSPDNSAMFLVERPRPVHSATYTPAQPDWINPTVADTAHRATALDSADFSAATSTTSVERLQRLITDEVKVIKQLKPDTLAVVLKPDVGTEILLQVHVRNGQIEAHARCERGDFNALNAQWSQLQQSLAGQGVRLMPLTETISTGTATSGNAANADASTGGRGQQQRGSSPAMENENVLAGTPSGKGKSTKANSRSSRGREWWA
jgi:hypothetical protein